MRSAAIRNRRRADDDEELDRPAARRPWWWRILLRRPIDSAAVLVALASATAIVVNAAYLQHGRHPAPMFALRPLPVAAAASPDIVGVVAHPREPAPDQRHDGPHGQPAERARTTPTSPSSAAPHRDPIAELLATHPMQPQQSQSQSQPVPRQAVLRPPEPVPRPAEPSARPSDRPSRHVLAVQRALSEFGYGQLKLTGVYDAETKAAVQRFEREHNLPVTDDISEATKRALAGLTGREIN